MAPSASIDREAMADSCREPNGSSARRCYDDSMATVLLPVIELEAGRFAAREHPMPTVGEREDPAGWDAWWRHCLEDAGVHIEPFRTASNYVTLSTLMACASLGTILARVADDDADPPDEVSALDGGFALVVDGAILLEPQCCCDLGNLDAWWKALSSGEEWQMLWIGHPWSWTRRRADTIEVAALSEDVASAVALATLPEDELRAAIADAARALQRAAAMLSAGHGSAPKMDRPLVDRLLGLDAWSPSLAAIAAA